MSDEIGPGVLELSLALRGLQRRFELDSVAGSRRLPDGHTITMRWSSDVLELEREDGEIVVVDTAVLS